MLKLKIIRFRIMFSVFYSGCQKVVVKKTFRLRTLFCYSTYAAIFFRNINMTSGINGVYIK